jgi:hypothetical protein
MPPARIETPTPSDVTGTYGPLAEEWAAVHLGDRLRPWQRYSLGRALEHRADGSLRWGEVLLTVSRQSGKTVLERGLCGWRASASDIFGEPQYVLSVANRKATAFIPWMIAARRAREWGAIPRYKAGEERIEWPDEYEPRGVWRIDAANMNAGVGTSISLACVDEAWNVERKVVEAALWPAMLERNDPQLWLISTAGDSTSDLFSEHRGRAVAQLGDPDQATVLILEWSAPPDAASDDPEAWRVASPHWNERRAERLAGFYRSTSDTDFRMQYLNQWVQGSSHAWVSDLAWLKCRDENRSLAATSVGAVAIETHIAGEPFGWVHATLDRDDGAVIVRAGVCASRRELWSVLEQTAAEHRGVKLLYPEGFRHHVPAIPQMGERIKIVTSETFAAYAATVAAIRSGAVAHAAQTVLTEQVLSAVPYTIADRGSMLSSRASSGPIYLARALVWAVGYELRPIQAPRPVVISG